MQEAAVVLSVLQSLESPVRSTAPAGFGGRLPGPPGSPPYTCCGTAR